MQGCCGAWLSQCGVAVVRGCYDAELLWSKALVVRSCCGEGLLGCRVSVMQGCCDAGLL